MSDLQRKAALEREQQRLVKADAQRKLVEAGDALEQDADSSAKGYHTLARELFNDGAGHSVGYRTCSHPLCIESRKVAAAWQAAKKEAGLK